MYTDGTPLTRVALAPRGHRARAERRPEYDVGARPFRIFRPFRAVRGPSGLAGFAPTTRPVGSAL